MRCFSEIIEEFYMRDLSLAGGCYTWYGGPNDRSSFRLDLFLVSKEWDSKLLPKPTSDYAPILLDISGIRSGKTPFRFENMWPRVEEFKDLVRRWWTGYTFSGSFGHILLRKLKVLKQDLKTWNKEVIGNVSSNKEVVLSQIIYWDAKERDGSFLEELEARRRAVEDISKWARME